MNGPISELQQLAIQPLMLKKIPNIVMTLRKVRKYIGPVTPHPDPQVCTEISTTYLTLIGMSYESKKNAQFYRHLGTYFIRLNELVRVSNKPD